MSKRSLFRQGIRWYRHGNLPARELPRVALRRMGARVRPYRYKFNRYLPGLVNVNTSVTDRWDYKSFCRLAATDDSAFQEFKRHPAYQLVLEHVSQEQGQQYFDIIKQRYCDLFERLGDFAVNDTVGSPVVFKYESGEFSPTTLRYVKIMGDLQQLFGSLEDKHMVEIGPAYGGQCVVVSAAGGFASYTGIDLAESLQLMRRYLAELSIQDVTLMEQNYVQELELYDLLISNYAFSECAKPAQDHYLEHVISKAKRGYITYNSGGSASTLHKPWTPYSRSEIIERLSSQHAIRILPEEPQTSSKAHNFVIIWDDTQ